MSELKLGSLIDDKQSRDAVHVAVAPVVAGERLSPGQYIGIAGKVAMSDKVNPIGIVDPFLKGAVFPGERFWMCLIPGTITSLRHEWTHPGFARDAPLGLRPEAWASGQWIRAFADRSDISYEELMSGAEAFLEYGDYLCDGGRWEGVYVPEEFWNHYEIVQDVKVPLDKRGSFFSCAC